MNRKPINVPKSPTFMPSKTFCVPEEIMVAVFYYGLGAYTTSSEAIASEIRAHNLSFTAKTRNLFIKEIKEELDRGEMAFDSPFKKMWERTLDTLQGKKPEEAE